MELSELVAYAAERYQIREEHNWAGFPGFSVLCHPDTGKWAALLMRQWDTELGEEIQRCDLKCGQECLAMPGRPYLTKPIRMKGRSWVGISFDERTDRDVVLRLFDEAVGRGPAGGALIVLGARIKQNTDDAEVAVEAPVYRETPLPSPDRAPVPQREIVPEKIRQLRQMIRVAWERPGAKAESFYHQATFMADYTDEEPWKGGFHHYFPTYGDMTTDQLRGYFSWRTQAREGKFEPLPESAVYLYVYELLNGIGANTVEERLEKLAAFETNFIDAGHGGERMRRNLHRWMMDLCVLHDLPAEIAQSVADERTLHADKALSTLRNPAEASDTNVFAALCHFGGAKTADTPVVASDTARGEHLFAEAWRAARTSRRDGKDLFELCFGKQQKRPWHPLSNAIYYQPKEEELADRDYELNECRAYRRRNGVWHMEAYEDLYFNRVLYRSFIHAVDAKFRRYLKTGRYLREKESEQWAASFAMQAIEADRRAIAEAARPKVHVNLENLGKIRADAGVTRDSLLTADEIADAEEEAIGTREEQPVPTDDKMADARTQEPTGLFPGSPAAPSPDLPLDITHMKVLRALMEGESTSEIIAANHLMPTVVADTINEYMFDILGDAAVSCDDDELALVDDYRADLEGLLGDFDG